MRILFILLLLCVLLLLSTVTSFAAETESRTHKNYINGSSDGLFHPDDGLTRAELAQIIYNLGSYEDAPGVFPDVSDDDWFAPAVNALCARQILKGDEKGNYRPNSGLTRAELVTVLSRLWDGAADETEAKGFPDVKDHWGKDAILQAQSFGWVNGYPDGTFHPDDGITRAEAVTAINRFLGRKPDTDALTETSNLRFFPDVLPTHWYYSDVMEAAVTHTLDASDQNERWLSVVEEPTVLSDGIYCLDQRLYVVENGKFVHEEKTGTVNGYAYICTGETGVCKVMTERLKLSSGELVFLKDGRPTGQPGSYRDGFYVVGGALYAVKNGYVVHKAGTDSVAGITFTCTEENGPCTAQAEKLMLADGELVLLKNTYLMAAPGAYADGFYCADNTLFAAKNGYLVHTAMTDSVVGVTFTCTGKNGSCTVTADMITTVDGSAYLLRGGKPDTTPGLVEYNGAMYYVQGSGTLVVDADYQSLHFGPDGKYTSGNAKIDAFVDSILAQCVNSSMTKQQKLRAVYDYVFYHVSYRSNNNHVPKGQDCRLWTETYMLRLIDQGKGNCYCYASEMYYLARRIGYWNAEAISGGTAPNDSDHAWLEIVINGTPYMFDPELESKNFSTPGHLFMVTYDATPWRYWRP